MESHYASMILDLLTVHGANFSISLQGVTQGFCVISTTCVNHDQGSCLEPRFIHLLIWRSHCALLNIELEAGCGVGVELLEELGAEEDSDRCCIGPARGLCRRRGIHDHKAGSLTAHR
eukprot:1361943-Amorphochlora_amoeboformis.AAC.1